MWGTFKSLVCFFNLLFLISVQGIVAVFARTRQYRFPTNNSLHATISLKTPCKRWKRYHENDVRKYLVCYTAVFSVVTQRSVGRSVA